MANNKVTLHRVFTASPEKIFKAFTDADAMASWLPPYGFVCKVHNMDTQVGGKYKMSFTNFGTGSSHSFGYFDQMHLLRDFKQFTNTIPTIFDFDNAIIY